MANFLVSGLCLVSVILACKNVETEKAKPNTPDNSKVSQNKTSPEIQNAPVATTPTPKVSQTPERLSLKLLKTEKGEYEFGLAKIQTTGIKATWKNDGNVPVYGIYYLFIESNSRGNSLRRKDITRRAILTCEKNQKIVAMPGETFVTLDMLDDRTVSYEVKLQEINPRVDWYEMAKVDCDGKAASVNYKPLSP